MSRHCLLLAFLPSIVLCIQISARSFEDGGYLGKYELPTIGDGLVVQKKPAKPAGYCNPPNPCPIGKTEADGCSNENFEDTLEFNKEQQHKLMKAGDCTCDKDHMYDCARYIKREPHPSEIRNGNAYDMFNNLMNYHGRIIAKKAAPRFKRSSFEPVYDEMNSNKLKRVAKKSPGQVWTL